MKNTSKFLFVLIFTFIFCAPLSAQDDSSSGSSSRRISTSGAAEVRVAPSRVVITLGVESRFTALAAARSDNDKRASAVLALAREIGIAPKDVQTDYIFVEPVYKGNEYGNSVLSHYTVRKTVVVLLRDTTKFEQLLTGALDRGATHVLNVRFESDNLKQHRDKARSDAIKAARDKAQALAGELGAKLGRVVSIQDYGSNDSSFNYGGSWQRGYYNDGSAQTQISSQSDSPISPSIGDTLALGQMRISARIDVTFELQ